MSEAKETEFNPHSPLKEKGIYNIDEGEVPGWMNKARQEQAQEALVDVQERMRALRERLAQSREKTEE